MKIAWLTDLHLNFVCETGVNKLCDVILSTDCDAILITGDIASARQLCRQLEYLAGRLMKPIYFVLGNHDYYGSSIRQMNSDVGRLTKKNLYLVWLSRSGIVQLSPDTCLIGHEGLADGRLGDPFGSTVVLNDYFHIEELRQPTKELRIKVQNKLGDAAARYLKKQLKSVVAAGYRKIIVALHVPPFPEACWHLGQNTDDNFLPHFSCEATGAVLKAFSLKHADIDMSIFCGHTHSGGYAQILPNLQVHTSGAEYRDPRISGFINVDAATIEERYTLFDPAVSGNALQCRNN